MSAISNLGFGSGRQYKEDSTYVNTADMQSQALGQSGFTFVNDTTTKTATSGKCYFAIQVIADCVLNTLTADSTAPIIGTITGVTLIAGTIIYGKFTVVKLTSGSAVLYNGTL